jgi:hypothetical protein
VRRSRTVRVGVGRTPEIAEDLATTRDVSERILDEIDGLDPSDQQALEAAVAAVDPGPGLTRPPAAWPTTRGANAASIPPRLAGS